MTASGNPERKKSRNGSGNEFGNSNADVGS
jgi:hypothetical protein